MNNKAHFMFDLSISHSKDGDLIAIENCKHIPFKMDRIFYEFGMDKKSVKGNHANKKSRFCIIALHGSCFVDVDDGFSKTTYFLDNPHKCLYLDKMIWKTMRSFDNNCVLLILSDSMYDPNEYIRDYSAFLKCVGSSNKNEL